MDPTKFFPVADKSVGFSFSWELDGTRVSKSYTKKVLALAQPKTWKEMEHYLGVIGYIRNHIYNCSRLTYWLHELKYHCGVKGKIKWTKQGELAFNQIQHLYQNVHCYIIQRKMENIVFKQMHATMGLVQYYFRSK